MAASGVILARRRSRPAVPSVGEAS
jgi:hypothetical protein